MAKRKAKSWFRPREGRTPKPRRGIKVHPAPSPPPPPGTSFRPPPMERYTLVGGFSYIRKGKRITVRAYRRGRPSRRRG